MSSAPCDAHGAVARGRLASVYPALIRDGSRVGSKRKYCQDCLFDLLSRHKQDWQDSFLAEYFSEHHACYSCGAVAEQLATLRRFYCTVYIDSKTRRDYCAYYCDECADLISEELVLHA